MKVLFIECKKKHLEEVNVDKLKLPKKLFIAYSIQYKELAESVKKSLERKKYKILGFSQVLGCTKLISKTPIVLISDGRFHALNLAMQNDVPIYIYRAGKIEKIDEGEIAFMKRKKETVKSKFFMASTIGILISTKPGQERKEEALALKNKILKKFPEKEVFLFISNTINSAEFENFPIDFWINTACPRISEDSTKIVNSEDISEML